MKNLILLVGFIFILFISLSAQNNAQDDCTGLPNHLPGKAVNDFYNKIGNSTELELEALLTKYYDSTSIAIVILTVDDIGYENESDYARRIGNCWGVGKKDYNSGIVIFVSFEGNRAWAIATGKGMEQYLTDLTASSIGQEKLIPNLQAGNPDEAFKSTVNAIINYLGWKSWEMRAYWDKWDKETAQLEKNYHNKEVGRGFGVFFIWVIYLALIGDIIWCIWKWDKEVRTRKRHREEIEGKTKEFLQQVKKLEGLKVKYEDIIVDMQKKHPENVWRDLYKNLLTVYDVLGKAEENLQKAFNQNKKIKDFKSLDNAYETYTFALSLLSSVEHIYKSIDNTVTAQANAKKEYKKAESSAKKALEKAVKEGEKECEKKKVESEAKKLKDQAEDKMEKAEAMLSSGIVDWVWLVALFVSIKNLAESSYNRTDSGYSYTSHHSSSSSSSSSHSSSSFGGYGGGHFGGGGAGGHW